MIINTTTDSAQPKSSVASVTIPTFVSRALAQKANGWNPIPLPKGKKAPVLVRGITGYSPDDADPEDFEIWPQRFGPGINLGLRLAEGVIGIDIDDGYPDKHGRIKCGLETLAYYESLWGKLPPTFRLTARPYETGSGIRLYRVPIGWRGPPQLKAADGSRGDIELIQRHHRFVLAPDSLHHTGAPYSLYDECTEDEIVSGILPPIDELGRLS